MEGLLVLLVVLLWSVLPAPLCAQIASNKGYPSGSAFIWGLLFGWLAVLVYASRANKKRDAEDQAAMLADAVKPNRQASGAAVHPLRTDKPSTSHDITKRCPDCAESVKAAALLCRFCGHKFTATETEKALEESNAALRERLLCALDDDEWEVRVSAVRGLKAIGDPSVTPRLFDAMASAVRRANSWKTDQWDDEIAQGTRLFSTAVVEALVSFREAGLPYLVRSLESNPLRGETAGLLVRIGAPAAELLEKAIPGSEVKVRKRIEGIVADIRRKAPRASGLPPI